MFVSLKNNHDFDGEIIYHIFQDIIWKSTNEQIDQILDKSRKDESYAIIGLVENNNLIGIIIYRSENSKVIIEYFGVESIYRHKGIGSKLIDEVIRKTKANYIVAETEDDAVNFYRKYGFAITMLGKIYPERNHYRCEYRTSKNGYWEKLERLITENGITIDRKKGSMHPKYSDLIYVVDYGYINNTKSMDNNGIGVFKGFGESNILNGIFCTIDSLKNDSEIKIAIDCDIHELEKIKKWFNNSKYMKAIYIEKDRE
jgi:inorganic pyrophosphatase